MLDKTSYNDKGKANGYWEMYYRSGQLNYIGNYINNERNGYWEVYYQNGNLAYKKYYAK